MIIHRGLAEVQACGYNAAQQKKRRLDRVEHALDKLGTAPEKLRRIADDLEGGLDEVRTEVRAMAEDDEDAEAMEGESAAQDESVAAEDKSAEAINGAAAREAAAASESDSSGSSSDSSSEEAAPVAPMEQPPLEQPQELEQPPEQDTQAALLEERQRLELLRHPVVAEVTQRLRDRLTERVAELTAVRQEAAAAKRELQEAKDELHALAAADPLALADARRNVALAKEAEALRGQVAELQHALAKARAELETARLHAVGDDKSAGSDDEESLPRPSEDWPLPGTSVLFKPKTGKHKGAEIQAKLVAYGKFGNGKRCVGFQWSCGCCKTDVKNYALQSVTPDMLSW